MYVIGSKVFLSVRDQAVVLFVQLYFNEFRKKKKNGQHRSFQGNHILERGHILKIFLLQC